MDTNVLLVICLVVFLVVGINGILLLLLRRQYLTRDIEMARKTAQVALNPWRQEQEEMDELSQLVGPLKDRQDTEADNRP